MLGAGRLSLYGVPAIGGKGTHHLGRLKGCDPAFCSTTADNLHPRHYSAPRFTPVTCHAGALSVGTLAAGGADAAVGLERSDSTVCCCDGSVGLSRWKAYAGVL